MIGATQAYSAGKFAEDLRFPQAIGKLVPEPPTAKPIETSKKIGGNGSEKTLLESVFNIHPAKPNSLPNTNFHPRQCVRAMITVFGVEGSVPGVSAVTF